LLTNSPTPNDPTSDVSQAEDIPSSRERVDDSSVDVESVVSVVGQKERVGDAAKTKTEGERERSASSSLEGIKGKWRDEREVLDR